MPVSLDQWMWIDPRLQGTPFEAKGLYAYLVTHPKREICGIYYLPRALILDETGLPPDRLENRLSHLAQRQLIELDDQRKLVWVIDMLHHQGCRRHLSWQQATWVFSQVRAMEDRGTPLAAHWLEHYHDWTVGRRPGEAGDAPPQTPYTIGYRYSIDTLSIGTRNKNQDPREKKQDPRAPEKMNAQPAKRGTRIPPDWQPRPEDLTWAHANGYDRYLDLATFTESFKYFWEDRARDNTKVSWWRTWRNRMIEEVKRSPLYRREQTKTLKAMPSAHDPDWQARVERKIAQEQQEDPRRASTRAT